MIHIFILNNCERNQGSKIDLIIEKNRKKIKKNYLL